MQHYIHIFENALHNVSSYLHCTSVMDRGMLQK